ncbi:MAG: DUF456 domain-containing protein, partial [Dermatophilaceae bacterium]
GIVVPILPGLVIVWLATLVWALEGQTSTSWVVLAIATGVYAGGLVAQYFFPGRRMKAAGVSTTTVVIALIVAVIGFFVIPVVGAPIGFVAAIYLIEQARHRDPARARAATGQAVRAVALNIGIELATGLSIMTTWGVGVWLSRA